MLKACSSFDVVVVQKKLPTILDGWLIRLRAKRLVFDFDDALYFRHEDKGGGVHPTSSRRFAALLPRVDLVIAGNRHLAEEASKFAERVEVLPSSVHVKGVPRRVHDEKSQPVVIGWVGGTNNLGQAKLLAPVLERIATKVTIELRVISGEALSLEGVPCSFLPWSAESQHEALSTLDIGVMPLPDSPHARGKCGYKALQYMAAGVPAVVSDVGVNREIVGHRECGLVASSIPDFEAHLTELAEGAELRRELGERGRKRAAELYAVEVVAGQLHDLLVSIA